MMNEWFILIAEFFKTGLFAIGGGMATLPFLYEMAGKYDWFTVHELTDMLAVSESTPGAIGINMATYAGNSAEGLLGGIVSTISLITPAIIIVMVIARALEAFKKNHMVLSAMEGIRPAATGLIAAAGAELFYMVLLHADEYGQTGTWTSLLSPLELGFFLVAAVLIFVFKKHPIVYIIGGALAGILIGL